MFEPVKIKEWKCKDPEKIVQTRFLTKDKMEIHEAKFSLDEINNIKERIKERIEDWYFIQFKSFEEESALPKSIIEENFNLSVA